jgi:hypothetical protein
MGIRHKAIIKLVAKKSRKHYCHGSWCNSDCHWPSPITENLSQPSSDHFWRQSHHWFPWRSNYAHGRSHYVQDFVE